MGAPTITGAPTIKGLLRGHVVHTRYRPKRNHFRYGMYYLCFGLRETEQLRSWLFSLNRFNLFSLHAKDYGPPRAFTQEPLDAWVRALLRQWGLAEADGDIVLLTLPRVLGHVFNPVSFWFCLDAQGNLRAVLSEVNNTFGDRHCYLSFHADRRVIAAQDVLESQKIFHVSPFLGVTGQYRFRFHYSETRIKAHIDYYDDAGLMLTALVSGTRTALTPRALLGCFFRYPLVTLKVIALIHYQALKLVLKGLRYRPRPTPPSMDVSS